NLAEHFILNVYIGAQQLLFVWLLIPVLEISFDIKQTALGVYTVAVVLYNIWVYVSFFGGKVIPALIKAVLAVLFAYVAQILVNFLLYIALRPFLDWLDAIF